MWYYGDRGNIITEVLLSRHEFFITHHMMTHLTTHPDRSEVEANYGKRIRSRKRNVLTWYRSQKGAEGERR